MANATYDELSRPTSSPVFMLVLEGCSTRYYSGPTAPPTAEYPVFDDDDIGSTAYTDFRALRSPGRYRFDLKGLEARVQTSPRTVVLDCAGPRAYADDPGIILGRVDPEHDGVQRAKLTQTVDQTGAVNWYVDREITGTWPRPLHAGREALWVTGVVAGPDADNPFELQVLYRGILRSAPQRHVVTPETGEIYVTDQIVSWKRRRAWLYMAAGRDDGTQSDFVLHFVGTLARTPRRRGATMEVSITPLDAEPDRKIAIGRDQMRLAPNHVVVEGTGPCVVELAIGLARGAAVSPLVDQTTLESAVDSQEIEMPVDNHQAAFDVTLPSLSHPRRGAVDAGQLADPQLVPTGYLGGIQVGLALADGPDTVIPVGTGISNVEACELCRVELVRPEEGYEAVIQWPDALFAAIADKWSPGTTQGVGGRWANVGLTVQGPDAPAILVEYNIPQSFQRRPLAILTFGATTLSRFDDYEPLTVDGWASASVTGLGLDTFVVDDITPFEVGDVVAHGYTRVLGESFEVTAVDVGLKEVTVDRNHGLALALGDLYVLAPYEHRTARRLDYPLDLRPRGEGNGSVDWWALHEVPSVRDGSTVRIPVEAICTRGFYQGGDGRKGAFGSRYILVDQAPALSQGQRTTLLVEYEGADGKSATTTIEVTSETEERFDPVTAASVGWSLTVPRDRRTTTPSFGDWPGRRRCTLTPILRDIGVKPQLALLRVLFSSHGQLVNNGAYDIYTQGVGLRPDELSEDSIRARVSQIAGATWDIFAADAKTFRELISPILFMSKAALGLVADDSGGMTVQAIPIGLESESEVALELLEEDFAAPSVPETDMDDQIINQINTQLNWDLEADEPTLTVVVNNRTSQGLYDTETHKLSLRGLRLETVEGGDVYSGLRLAAAGLFAFWGRPRMTWSVRVKGPKARRVRPGMVAISQGNSTKMRINTE